MLPDPAAPGLIPSVPKIVSKEKIVTAVEVNQRHCLEESRQWLENADRTHLVLANGKPVLQKTFLPEVSVAEGVDVGRLPRQVLVQNSRRG